MTQRLLHMLGVDPQEYGVQGAAALGIRESEPVAWQSPKPLTSAAGTKRTRRSCTLFCEK